MNNSKKTVITYSRYSSANQREEPIEEQALIANSNNRRLQEAIAPGLARYYAEKINRDIQRGLERNANKF